VHRFAYRRDSLRDRARKETKLSEDKIQTPRLVLKANKEVIKWIIK